MVNFEFSEKSYFLLLLINFIILGIIYYVLFKTKMSNDNVFILFLIIYFGSILPFTMVCVYRYFKRDYIENLSPDGIKPNNLTVGLININIVKEMLWTIYFSPNSMYYYIYNTNTIPDKTKYYLYGYIAAFLDYVNQKAEGAVYISTINTYRFGFTYGNNSTQQGVYSFIYNDSPYVITELTKSLKDPKAAGYATMIDYLNDDNTSITNHDKYILLGYLNNIAFIFDYNTSHLPFKDAGKGDISKEIHTDILGGNGSSIPNGNIDSNGNIVVSGFGNGCNVTDSKNINIKTLIPGLAPSIKGTNPYYISN